MRGLHRFSFHSFYFWNISWDPYKFIKWGSKRFNYVASCMVRYVLVCLFFFFFPVMSLRYDSLMFKMAKNGKKCFVCHSVFLFLFLFLFSFGCYDFFKFVNLIIVFLFHNFFYRKCYNISLSKWNNIVPNIHIRISIWSFCLCFVNYFIRCGTYVGLTNPI